MRVGHRERQQVHFVSCCRHTAKGRVGHWPTLLVTTKIKRGESYAADLKLFRGYNIRLCQYGHGPITDTVSQFRWQGATDSDGASAGEQPPGRS